MPKDDIREIYEGRQYQGTEEELAYRLDTANWSTTPTSPATPSAVSVAIYSVVDTTGTVVYTDTTVTNLSGAASVSGQYITTPAVIDLVVGTLYRIEIKFTLETNIWEAYAYIQGER